jgi:hypothetical protein
MECVVLNALVTHALCRLISCAFGERNTSSSTRSLIAAGYVVRLRRSICHRLDDKPIHLFAALGPLHAYLEKG